MNLIIKIIDKELESRNKELKINKTKIDQDIGLSKHALIMENGIRTRYLSHSEDYFAYFLENEIEQYSDFVEKK